MRISLRWKIAGGFGAVLVLILLLGAVTLSLIGSLRQAQERVFDEAVPGLRVVGEIVRSYTAQSAAVRGYLLGFNPELLDEYEDEKAIAADNEARARRLFTTPAGRELLSDLIAAGDDFEAIIDERVLPAADRGDRAVAISVLRQDGSSQISLIQSLGARLRSAQDGRVAETEEALESGSNRARLVLLAVFVGAVAMGLVLAIALPRRLVADLSRLVTAARAVGRGDFEHPVAVASSDEIEELAHRFNEMQAGLKRLQQLALQDRELEIAASIQRNLHQRRLPDMPGAAIVPMQRQANLVGGDWYDVDVTGRMLTVAVGDASGKGIGAALMATVALSVLRSERGLGAGPARVVERANQALIDVTEPDSFTTVVYATIDLDSGDARWFSMGHPPPFLLPADPGDGSPGRFVDGPRNKALGWFEDPGLDETTVRLRPGDRLLLFTDGFLEAKSSEGELFGEQRFAAELLRYAALPASEMVDRLVAAVELFAAGKLDDDLTILVVEFQGAPVAGQAAQGLTGEEAWHSRR